MIEGGKRRASTEILENIADALGIPFHLFVLLASEPSQIEGADPNSVRRLAVGLSKLLLSGGKRASGRGDSPKAEHSEPKASRRPAQSSSDKARKRRVRT